MSVLTLAKEIPRWASGRLTLTLTGPPPTPTSVTEIDAIAVHLMTMMCGLEVGMHEQ